MTTANDDNWVVVSGAGGALGNALTVHYGDGGRRMLALDRQFDTDWSPAAHVTTAMIDLRADREVQRALSVIAESKAGISLLINAVGLIWNEPLLALNGGKFVTHDVASWRDTIEANLTASFIVAKHVAAHMARHGGGCIVNFSSIAGRGNAGQAAYSAAKAGVEGLSRAMAAELGPLGVRVNAVALGFIDAVSTRKALPDKRLQQYAEQTPLGRLGRIEDVIGAIDFLASNAFVNGAIVPVDGGLRL
jgi:3-oxoacyl-[acyl-carrier protein] reductase